MARDKRKQLSPGLVAPTAVQYPSEPQDYAPYGRLDSYDINAEKERLRYNQREARKLLKSEGRRRLRRDLFNGEYHPENYGKVGLVHSAGLGLAVLAVKTLHGLIGVDSSSRSARGCDPMYDSYLGEERDLRSLDTWKGDLDGNSISPSQAWEMNSYLRYPTNHHNMPPPVNYSGSPQGHNSAYTSNVLQVTNSGYTTHHATGGQTSAGHYSNWDEKEAPPPYH